LRLTHALRRPATAPAAARALRGDTSRATVEALVEVVERPPSSSAAVEAIATLEPVDEPIVLNALNRALMVSFGQVRLAALASIRRRAIVPPAGSLARIIREDPSWTNRRAALIFLTDLAGTDDPAIFEAATDPHWRVRHALIQRLLPRGATPADRRLIEEQLNARASDDRARGVFDYLQYRWSSADGFQPTIAGPRLISDPSGWCPFWDWDPAVLARELRRMRSDGRRRALDLMPRLLGHDDERVRRWAFEAIRESGQARHLAEVVRLLDEPRHEGSGLAARLMFELEPDLDRVADLACFILALPQPSVAQLAWAIRQFGPGRPTEHIPEDLTILMGQATSQPAQVRRPLASLAARWDHPLRDGWLRRFLEDADPLTALEAVRGINEIGGSVDVFILERLLRSEEPALRAEAIAALARTDQDESPFRQVFEDPDARVRVQLAQSLSVRPMDTEASVLARLQQDHHPAVRAAALTSETARELMNNPAQETSWTVLERAARLQRIPFARLEPRSPWQPDLAARPEERPLTPAPGDTIHARRLGRGGPLVSPLGLSGHYGLPVEGFVKALETGVNLMFWEPNYDTMTRFMNRLSPQGRTSIHLIAGTFEAEGDRVRRDAERALRSLRVERLAVFLLFWVRSWTRISDDVLATLHDLREAGKMASFGLSTHDRELAVEALERGWNPVMVRHSAAHRKAEAEIFPKAVALGAGLITFNATCYGRLLGSTGIDPSARAADCYRYSLSQPGVAACLTAPATIGEMDQALEALHNPELSEERVASLKAWGDLVYREDAIFRSLVRRDS
jgi:HEAT repeat protein